jgi:catechol 2,3-dioxygenase-like lactoylglutathione lyase family enzyme
MRLDHIAYRSKDRHRTAKFFEGSLGYKVGTSFEVKFDDGSHADCLALVPPEVRHSSPSLWTYFSLQADPMRAWVRGRGGALTAAGTVKSEYHAPPEIFVSDGAKGSIVGDWVANRDGIGGIHHIAYQVEDVAGTMREWREKGYAEFLSEEPMECPGLKQVFTKPSELTGVIYELISREDKGFCELNVKGLMESSKGK